MFLSNVDIRAELLKGCLTISPLWPGAIQPASIDVHLGDTLLIPKGGRDVDPADDKVDYVQLDLSRCDGFPLGSGRFLLGTTLEEVSIPDYLVCRIEGVSTRGRQGLSVHTTAGWVDPGFRGKLTLEMYNVGPSSFLLRPGMRVGQLSFARLETPANPPYSGRYQGQNSTVGSKSGG